MLPWLFLDLGRDCGGRCCGWFCGTEREKVFIRKKLPGFGRGCRKSVGHRTAPLIVTSTSGCPTGAFRGRVAAAASSKHSLSRTVKLTKTIKPNGIYMRFDLMASLPTMCATSWGRPAFRQTARANAHKRLAARPSHHLGLLRTKTEISRLFSNARLYHMLPGLAPFRPPTITGILCSYAMSRTPMQRDKTRSALKSREWFG